MKEFKSYSENLNFSIFNIEKLKNPRNLILSQSQFSTLPVAFDKLLIQTGRPDCFHTQSSAGPALLEHLQLLRQQEETFQHRLDSDRVLKRRRGVCNIRPLCFTFQADAVPLQQRQDAYKHDMTSDRTVTELVIIIRLKLKGQVGLIGI